LIQQKTKAVDSRLRELVLVPDIAFLDLGLLGFVCGLLSLFLGLLRLGPAVINSVLE